MVELSRCQKRHLYEFILDEPLQERSINFRLEKTLGYIMSNVNVRKAEQIEDDETRVLVQCTFQLLKNDYLLENGLIASATHKETVSGARARAMQYAPACGLGLFVRLVAHHRHSVG